MGLRSLKRRLFARYYDRLTAGYEAAVREKKRALVAPLRGTVVEIGPGTGWNLPLVDPSVRWVGIEPSAPMREKLLERARELGREVEVRDGSAERLPFADGTVDAVIATLVLCSVADLPAALGEARRVLRPGGTLVFWEHVLAPAEQPWLRRAQRALAPLWRFYADGCRCDQETGRALQAAGFTSVELERFEAPAGCAPPWVRPHIRGTATR
jgi:ubiquinone/menaquinone biosynthesis C-methylase UbiE